MIGQPRNPTTGTGPLMPNIPGACPECQTTIPPEACWCPNCGYRANEPCWTCGRPLLQNAKFCAYCGTPTTEPAVVQCPGCDAVVNRGHGYCTACGTQARVVCSECDRPMREEWSNCPECGGQAVWEERGIVPDEDDEEGEEAEEEEPAFELAAPASSAEGKNQAGVKAYETGDFHEAARLFREATQADPTNASYFTNLGVACGEIGDDLQAFAAYRRAVELNPNELSAYLNMGYLYRERDRSNEAREMWEKVVALAPGSDEATEARENLRELDQT